MSAIKDSTVLFGGKSGWKQSDWTSSDDRVRGGKSQSFLQLDKSTANFCGNLDIDTLGGAGFASQRTTRDDRRWNLRKYGGISLALDPAQSDKKNYTFILKDQILPRDPKSGREQSTTSWEYDFCIEAHQKSSTLVLNIPWNDFKPTYRGKPQQSKHPLQVSDIKRMSIMMRSHFGNQHGAFKLRILDISVYKTHDQAQEGLGRPLSEQAYDSSISVHKEALCAEDGKSRSRWSRFASCFCHL